MLIACEESQRVCSAFRRIGIEAYSSDIIAPSGNHPEWHIQGDVLPIINGNCAFATMDGIEHHVDGTWDLIIAHPPCTYLSNAGACRLYPSKGKLDQDRYERGLQAKEFFMRFYNADCPRIVIENPMPSKVFELPEQSQVIQPYEYDTYHVHPYTKRTYLWIKGDLPLLKPTTPNEEPVGPYCPSGTSRKQRDKYGAAKRGDDAKNRSKTFIGIAEAFADQFGNYIRNRKEP